MISTCIEPGCSTLCIGLFCIEHDARPQVEFPRGRPWPPLGSRSGRGGGADAVRRRVRSRRWPALVRPAA